MNKLNQWLLNNSYFGYKKVIISLDNWSFHESKATKNNLSLFDATFMYIPPYSPTLTPVELIFGFLKKKFAEQNKQSKVKLNSKEADLKLFKVQKLIDGELLKLKFRKFYQELKINLNN